MAKRGSPDLRETTGITRAAGALFFGLAGTVLIVAAAALAALQIVPLRQAVLDFALAEINRGETKVEIGAIAGRWPTSLVLEKLKVSDAKGPWLSLDKAELDWRPTALLGGEFHIVRLSTRGLDVVRMPRRAAPSSEAPSLSLPVLPVDLRIDALSIGDLVLGAGLVDPRATADLARLDAEARLVLTANRLELDLGARGKGGTAGRLDAHVFFDRRDKRLDVRIAGEDGVAGRPSLVAALAGLRGIEHLSIEASGQTLGGEVWATARIDGGKIVAIGAQMAGRWGAALDLETRIEAKGDLVAQTLADLGRPQSVVAFSQLRWAGDDRLTLEAIGVRAGNLALDGRAEIDDASSSLHDFKAQGTLRGLDRLLDEPDNSALTPLEWRIAAKLDERARLAHVAEAVVTARPGTVRYAGEVAFDLASAKGIVEAEIADLAPLGALLGQRLAGRAKITLSPFVRDAGSDIAGDVVIEALALDVGDKTLNRVFGGDLAVDGSVIVPREGGFALPAVTVTPASGAYRLQGNFATGRTGILSGEAHFSTGRIEALLADADLAGVFVADATFSGTRNAPAATLKAALSDGRIAGFETQRTTLDAVLRQSGEGPLALRFDGPDGSASIDATLALPPEGGVTFDAITTDLFGTPLAGTFVLSRSGLLTGSLKGAGAPLGPLARLAGLPIDGRGDISLAATVAQDRQDLSLAIAAPRLMLGGDAVILDRAELTATANDIAGDMTITGKLSAVSGLAGITRLTTIGATAKGSLAALTLSLDVAGTRETFKPEPVSLTAQALYASGMNRLSVSGLRFAIAESSIALARPIAIDLHSGASLRGVVLALDGPSGSGRVEGDMALAARAARLRLRAETVPLELVAPFLLSQPAHGTAAGRIDLDSAKGTGAVFVRFDGVRLSEADERIRPAFDATIDGRWTNGRFNLSARAEGVSTKPFDLQASLPAIRDPEGAWPVLAPRGSLSARLDWQGPVASLLALADVQNQQLSGEATVALSASGDISAPKVSGRAAIANGAYENFDSGAVLRDLALSLEGHESESLHFSLSARDDAKGRVAAEGDIRFTPGLSPAISVAATLANARLVRTAEADIAFDGKLDLTGPVFPPTSEAPLTLKGDLTTTLAQIRIPEQAAENIRQIDVVEINGLPSRHSAALQASPLPLDLDLNVKIGAPARVSGRGIDSLWTGALAVTGRAQSPRIAGTLTSLRGNFDLAGKNFALKKGAVRFSNRTPIDPDLDIALTYARSDFSATVSVSGPSSAPEIAFTSTPALPRDEILSRILFDKGAGELSAMEAVQLANTLTQLTGKGGFGGGPGILGSIQAALGLDVLQIGTAKSGATTIALGKYIQQGVYVGVEQGTLASDSSVKVEIEVTPHISVDTRVGQNASGDVGLNWKWDY